MERRQTQRAGEWTAGESGRATDASESGNTEKYGRGDRPGRLSEELTRDLWD